MYPYDYQILGGNILAFVIFFNKKRFDNRETIRGIRARMAEILQLYHDWLRPIKGYEGYLLNYPILNGICFSSVKYLLYFYTDFLCVIFECMCVV